jgi:hypothetical protein
LLENTAKNRQRKKAGKIQVAVRVGDNKGIEKHQDRAAMLYRENQGEINEFKPISLILYIHNRRLGIAYRYIIGGF